MKKYIFTVLLLFVGSMTVMAGSGIKVTKGNKNFLKTAEGNAVLFFDWENATFDNKEPLVTKFSNLDALSQVAYNGFTEIFNKKQRVKIVADETDTKYRFTTKVTNMDQYFKVMGIVPGNATKVWGILTITGLSTGEVFVVIEVNEVDGGANPSPDGSFSDCFEELAKLVAKLK